MATVKGVLIIAPLTILAVDDILDESPHRDRKPVALTFTSMDNIESPT